MTGEGWRRRLRVAADSFVASARNPAVRRIQLGFAGACTAEWTFTVVLSVYAFSRAGAKAVGLVSLLRMVPSAMLAPFASALADRWRRDLGAHLVSATRCVTAAAIAVIVATAVPGGGYGPGDRSTAAAILYRPVNSALLPLLCHTAAELASANVVARAARLDLDPGRPGARPASLLAGGRYRRRLRRGRGRLGTLGGGDARSHRRGARAPRQSQLGPLRPRAGAKVSARSPQLRVLLTLLAAQVLTRGALSVFSVLVAVDLLDLGEPGVGTLTAAIGAGAIVGSLFASDVRRATDGWPSGSARAWPCGVHPWSFSPPTPADPRPWCCSR